MAEQKKRTYDGVYNALRQIGDEEGIDFGLDNMSAEDFKRKYFTGPGNIENLYHHLNKISNEEGIDFGQGSRDEWLSSFGYKRNTDGQKGYMTLDGKIVGRKDSTEVRREPNYTFTADQVDSIERRIQRGNMPTSFDADLTPSQPLQMPQGFGQLDVKQAQRMGLGKGPVSWGEESGIPDQEETAVEKQQRMMQGKATQRENKQVQSRMQQRKDEIAYKKETGKDLRNPVLNTNFEAPTVEHDDNGNILIGNSTDQDRASAHQQVMTEQAAWDALSESEKQDRMKQMQSKIEQDEYEEPGFLGVTGKKLGSGFIKAGLGLLNGMKALASGMIVEDASSPTGYSKTEDYNPATNNDAFSRGLESANQYAERMSREGEPRRGASFTEMLLDGDISGFLLKGWGSSLESAPMTLSIYNPYTVALNAISMAGNNFRDNTIENPDIPAWKRASMAIGSAAIEQAVEKFADPVFKYFNGGRILSWFGKTASKDSAKKITKEAESVIANRIMNVLKDAASEGAEEVVTNFGNDVLGQALDWLNGESDYGIVAQWRDLKKSNPNASLADFAAQKAKENLDAFFGGALGGAYMSGTAQVTAAGLQYATGNKVSPEQMANTNEPIHPATLDVAQSFDEGYLIEGQERNDAKNNYDLQRQKVVDTFGNIEGLDADPIATLQAMREVGYTPEQLQIALDYVNAKATYDGMIQRVHDDLQGKVDASNSLVDSHTNKADGMVHPITTTTDTQMYVVGGQVVIDADGNVDADKSKEANPDGMLLAVDAESGKVVTIAVDDIKTADTPIDAQQQKQQAQQAIMQQFGQQAADRIEGKLSFAPNDQYNVLADDGQPHVITVLQDNGDGSVTATIDGMQDPAVMSKEQVQAWADAANLARLQQHEQQQADSRAQQAAEEQQADIEPLTDDEIQVANNQQSDTPEGDAGAATGTEANEPSGVATPQDVAMTSQPTQEEETRPAIERIPVLKDDSGKPVLNRKGKPQYQWHQAPVEDTADALTEQAAGSMLVARDVAADMIAKAKDDAEKANKMKAKGDDPIELIESRNAIAKAQLQAQDIVRYWQDVNKELQRRLTEETNRKQAEREAAKSEEQRRQEAEQARLEKERNDEAERQRIREQIERDQAKRNKEYEPLVQARKEMQDDAEALSILDDTEPRDLQEWVSSLLRAHSILWQDASDAEVGLKTELGLKRADIQRFMSLLGTKESGAKPFGQVVLDIYEGLPDAVKQQVTDQDVRNTLLDLFNEGSSSRMMNLTKEHRIEEARQVYNGNLQREADAEMDAWCEAYHLTAEERATFEDFMQEQPMEPEQEIINQIIADDEQNQSSERMDQQPVSGRNAEGTEEGESQVQGAVEAAVGGTDTEAVAQGTDAGSSESTVPDDNVAGGTLKYKVGDQFDIVDDKGNKTLCRITNIDNDGKIELVIGSHGNLNRKLVSPEILDEYRERKKEADTRDELVAFVDGMVDDEDTTFVGNMTREELYELQELADEWESDGKWSKVEAYIAKMREKYPANESANEPANESANEPANESANEPANESANESANEPANESANGQQPIGKTSTAEEIAAEEGKVDTNPTDAQKEAGNYQKGHINIDGYDITIENPKGSTRSGVDANGNKWETTMHNTYGYIRGTEGVDGDHIDVFLSDNPTSGNVFVIDQVNPETGEFDEHKVMYGFPDAESARKAYLSNYSEGWQGLGEITEVSREEFKKWVESSHRKTKPFAEYKSVKKPAADASGTGTSGNVRGENGENSGKGEKVKNEATPKQKIDDVGEKIGGARKDLAQKMSGKINLDADTFPKMFPKFDLKKAVEDGLDPKLAASVMFLRSAAYEEYKRYSKRYTKEKALASAKFFAAYAKQILESGNTDTEFTDNGFTFTDYGKEYVKLNIELFRKLHDKMGDDLFSLDVSGYEVQPIGEGTRKYTKFFRKNAKGETEEYSPYYSARTPHGASDYYEEGEKDKAIDAVIDKLTNAVSYNAAHPYKLSHYYMPGVANSHYIGVKLGGKVVALTEKMSDKETSNYLKEHEAELQEKARMLDEERKQKKGSKGEGEGRWKPELNLGGGRARVGEDYRNGRDVDADEFRGAFGFRGVEFGNYVTQKERQRFINEAYDAMMDLAALLGVSPKALSLGGRLGFAIGARGGGNAMAHYEPDLNVINLTKSKGAGSLAHEWWHALDYYFNRMGDKRKAPATTNRRAEDFNPGQRREMEDAFVSLMDKINDSDYRKRSVALDAALNKDYYTNPTELGARAFQDYVQRRLTDKGQVNDFLSSFTPEERWNGKAETYPYPTGKEADEIDERFDNLFGTMLERENEQGNVILYEKADGKATRVSAKEQMLRDGVVELMQAAGIDVSTDWQEGQQVLDAANGVREQRADNPVYYSNALRAVEGIKQEKATPEQWLAMIAKAGGLKAGEDKWLGLSDWLKEQKGSVTKQDIVDYIKQNQIQVEEKQYHEVPDGTSNKLKELNKEYTDICNKLFYEIDDPLEIADKAFEQMKEKYGEDFENAVELVSAGHNTFDLAPKMGIDDLPTDDAMRFLGIDPTHTINDTRLNYTTEGLKNKKEIAITVPTVEPYNESDKIHFGDAGGGRAVAWVRFGDAQSPKPEKIYKTVEEFEAPTSNGRGLDIYYPKGGKFTSRDYVAYGKAKDGKMVYVPIMNHEQIKACSTLEEAREVMNDWYREHNVGETQYDRVLVIDEIQSKRHQDGREKGYKRKNPISKEDANRQFNEFYFNVKEKYGNKPFAEWSLEDRNEYQRLDRQRTGMMALNSDALVPDAPFDKNWHELAMKRMLRYAAEHGYDKVAWTKGEQQAERYSLGGSVKNIQSYINDDGTRRVNINFENEGGLTCDVDNNGTIVSTSGNTQGIISEGMSLNDVVGKELGQKIVQGEGEVVQNKFVTDREVRELSGDGLRVGGEGMKGFYDTMLPRFMDKYGKKWGMKVGEVELPELEESARTMWGVDVTPAMKESVMQGQPMFFRTANGESYGYTLDGKIYVDPRIATAETPVHEYVHLWAEALRKANPKAWERLSEQVLGKKDVLEYVKSLYPELEGDALIEEVFAHFAGRRGAERLREEQEKMMQDANGVFEKAKVVSIFDTIRRALKDFFQQARDLFAGKVKGIRKLSAENFADMAMSDLVNGVKPKEQMKEASEKVRDMKAYHGSAAEFDRFDHSKIGSGEGQAVSGHGTYVTTSEGTARYYANVASDKQRKVVQEGGYTLNGKMVHDPALYRAFEYLKKAGGNINEAIKACEHTIEVLNRHKDKNPFAALRKGGKSVAEEAMDYLQQEKEKPGTIGYQDEIIEKPDRQLYEVEIPDDTGKNYLDLDKKLTKKQKSDIKKAFDNALDNSEDADYWKKNRDIIDYEWKHVDSSEATADTARAVMEQFIPSEKVSEIFSDMGYVGSKTKGSDGTTYIIYNDGDLQIKNRMKFQLMGKAGAAEADEAEESDEEAEEEDDVRMRDGEDAIVTNDEEEGDVRFREVSDEDTIEWLEDQPTVKVYRSMVLIDGKLYPPMSSKEADGKQLRQPSELGKWEESEEAPEKAVKRNGKWYFPLRKDNGKMLYAAYNPYIHTSRTMLNDQFSEAQDRDNLVVVEMEVPISELTSEYRAERAKDTTGVKQWKAGVIQGQLSGTREVILTRWAKPVRIVPVEEVAEHIADMLKGQVETMPTNVVTPQQREALEARGVKFVKTTNQGKIVEGESAGKTWASVYGKERGKSTMQREGAETPDANATSTTAAHEVADEWAQKLGLSDVMQVVDSIEDVPGSDAFSKRKRRAKGWYDAQTGKIVIVLGNHRSPADVLQTILHEAVGHYGLRKLFGQNFDTFLDNVYQSAALPIKERIAAIAAKQRQKDTPEGRARRSNQDYLRIATEEYLAGLAENTDFEDATQQGWWSKVKNFFIEMLTKAGFDIKLSDNELRYILWRSYKNMAEPGRYRNVFDVAENVAMEYKLGVGNYERDLFRDEEEDGEEDEDAADVDAAAEGYDAGKMTLEESITKGLLDLAQKNEENLQLRINAMRQIGGNLNKLRSAMARQREYDRQTVDSIVRLAKMVIDSGLFKGFTPYEVKRLMGMVNRAAGREDITKQAGEVVDLMIRHQLKELDELFHSQMKVKGSKLNNSGVEVQAGLDIDGQRMVKAMKDAMSVCATCGGQTQDQNGEPTAWGVMLEDVFDRMGDDDEATAHIASVEYQGYLTAQQWFDTVKSGELEERVMRHDLKQAKEEQKAGRMTREEYKQYRRETEAAIRESRLERIAAYEKLISTLGAGIKESIDRADEWRERERQRVNEIHHNANSDLLGVPADEHRQLTWQQKAANWSFVRFFMKPLATFNELLRYFGSKSVDGKGYLWNRFIHGVTDASDREWKNLHRAHEILDAKASEVFGKDMSWSDLFDEERKMPTVSVEFWDAGEKKSYDLTQGNLLYIYLVNKMTDGRMKLRKMGITEEDVEAIKDRIDPRFLALGEWLQDVFLKDRRKEYNAVYERMFGAPMPTVHNYFPLRINSRSRGQEEDIGEPTYSETKPATITGSVIKRTRNSLPLDLTGADAFDVVLGHLQDMEHWAAYAELNRDMNTLFSYKRFRNRVMNMSSTRFGAGNTLWKNFKDAAAIAAGSYRPPVNRNSLDTYMVNIAKGVTQAKIAFRLYTALKQLLSYPAYFSEANVIELVKSTNPFGGAEKAWKWAKAELPGFAKRWQSRQAGDNRLDDTDVDWQFWRNKIVRIASRMGMKPNAFVDALTVAMGAKAIYETRLKQYKTDGYSDEQAKQKALHDASVAYNETQQSSEGAYISEMQVARSATSVAFSVFRNAPFAYQRRLFRAIANLKHKMTPGYKKESIEFMRKQMVREGLPEGQAQQVAERVYNRSWYKDVANVAIFGFMLQAAWNLGPYLAYLFLGDDDDEKDKMYEDALKHAVAGSVEGLTSGNVMSDLYNMLRNGDNISSYNFNLLPLMSDVQTMMRHYNSDMVQAANDFVNIMVQSGVGVNPQTLTDLFVALTDYTNGDPQTSKEFALLMLRVASAPQSAIDKLYIDELGMTAADARKADVTELAHRYARYKRRRNAPLTGWAYSDEARDAAEGRYVRRFEDMLKERADNMSDESLQKAFEENSDEAVKKALGKIAAKRLDGTDNYGSPTTEYGKVYLRMRNYFDMAEDILLQTEEKKAKEAGDEERYDDIKKARKDLTDIKRDLADARSDEERNSIMQELRRERTQYLQEFGISKGNR